MKNTRKTFSERVMDTVIYGGLVLLSLSTLYPFINIIAKAFSSDIANDSGAVTLYPIDFQIGTLKYVMLSTKFQKSLTVSVVITLLGTLLGLVLTTLAAYPLAKKRLRGRKLLTILYVFTMIFWAGLIPNYIVMKNLKLLNTIWSLILPGAVNAYNMLIMKSYFESISESLEESAKIDGASNFRIFVTIMLPLSTPVLATLALFFAVGYWNEYFRAMMYITKTSLKPLQIYLRDVISESMQADTNINAGLSNRHSVEGVRAATILASTLPILIVYPYLQKYFVKGIMVGAVKG